MISAIGQVTDVRSCVTMDLKDPGNVLLLLGSTRNELGGSLWCQLHAQEGGRVPQVDLALGKRCMRAVHAAIVRGLLRSCHDLSEGGLAVTLAEMAFAGGLGAAVRLADLPREADASSDLVLLFSESPSRFVAEARPECLGELAEVWSGVPFCRLGEVTGAASAGSVSGPRLTVRGLGGSNILDLATAELKSAWQGPLNW